MKLSTKGRYGLRALVDLTVHSSKGHQPLAQIAERQNISEIYLEQVFATLRKNGVVKSIKGAQGGYLLNVEPANITVGKVLRILEGDLSIVDEKAKSDSEEKSVAQCVYKNVWEKIDKNINELVDSITLEELVEDYKKNHGMLPHMYHI
ncbi:RrF2 family transcriptional regulator [Alkalibacter saccharofermentans]|uniref:Transcriptional regulator, BadM/Rrf2 family n=1 Tax=Alkalibacter saccharofermentans DSM 14828 TaxID=1120975 RepID=A0A1M4YN44_9FIRM|nr:Rrf2 family transcriptional regulator [Alkalibacter saccharofermentans]SHF07057.1 transcriptional regulator, BadM/Rrf2 family [Alkalibacter saccharofermentans DSM 14828]